MKTIFISSFQPFISRNILNSEALTVLRNQADTRIVILVPRDKIDFFSSYFSFPNVIIEGINTDAITNSRITKFFHNRAFLFIDSHYARYTRREQCRADESVLGMFKFRTLNAIVRFCSRSSILKNLYRTADRMLTPHAFFAPYFDKYSPDVVFAADIYTMFDQALLSETIHRGIRTIGMIRSWDNNYSKGLCRFRPDVLLVNNETIASEAVEMHGFDPSSVRVVGIPQFDCYTTPAAHDRETFFRLIGADPSKRLVLVSPAGYPLVPGDVDSEICDILREAQDNGQLPDSVQFLIRSHPHRPAPIREGTFGPNILIDTKTITYQGAGKRAEFSPADQEHLKESLLYSDVIVWAVTSLGLDALVFDKPQVIIHFDGRIDRPYWKSVRRYYDEDHMRKFLNTGFGRVVDTPADMVSEIRAYLREPTRDASQRRAGLLQQLWRVDGRAGKRIAEAVLDVVRS